MCSQCRQEQEESQSQKKQQTEKKQSTVYTCANCGTAHAASDKFCSECGMGLTGNTCVHCGAETHPNWEICPSCGHNLQAELCSFCGGKMTPGDAFCPECGNPRTGIVCGSCNTLNFRSFCRKCNAPLNELAQQALAEARKDPKVQRVIAIAQELEELEEIMAYFAEEEEGDVPELPEISEEDRELLNQYKDLLSAYRGQEAGEKEEQPETPVETPKKEKKPAPKFSINMVSKEEAMQKYKEKIAEMQETLSSMLPDANMTPQMQRDYYSARKVDVRKPGKVYWECTAYKCLHDAPNQCSKTWKGGVWKYVPDEDIIVVYGGPM